MRLIDADELKEFVKEKCSYCTSFIGEESVLSWIDKAPTIEEVDECPQNDTNIGTTDKCDKCFYKSAIKDFELFGEAEPSEMSVNVEYNVEYLPDKDGIHQAKATITKIEPICETCRHNDEEWYSTACDSCCGSNSHYEPSDLISREEVHKVLSLLATEGGKDAKLLFSDAHESIDALPSADGHEYNLETIADIVRQLGYLDSYIADTCDRPKGEWIIRDDMPKLDNTYSIECSECGQLMFGHYNSDDANYCPTCGAEMKGDDTE